MNKELPEEMYEKRHAEKVQLDASICPETVRPLENFIPYENNKVKVFIFETFLNIYP